MRYAINPKKYHLGVAKPFPDLPVRTGLAGISVAMTAQMWSWFCDRSVKTHVPQATQCS